MVSAVKAVSAVAVFHDTVRFVLRCVCFASARAVDEADSTSVDGDDYSARCRCCHRGYVRNTVSES